LTDNHNVIKALCRKEKVGPATLAENSSRRTTELWARAVLSLGMA
jgi:hypothetical protein